MSSNSGESTGFPPPKLNWEDEEQTRSSDETTNRRPAPAAEPATQQRPVESRPTSQQPQPTRPQAPPQHPTAHQQPVPPTQPPVQQDGQGRHTQAPRQSAFTAGRTPVSQPPQGAPQHPAARSTQAPPQQPAPQTPPRQQPAPQTPPRQQPAGGVFGQQEQEYMGAAGLLDEIGTRQAEFARPEKGWRRFAYDVTNGRMNKISPQQRERMALIERIQGTLTGEVAHVGVWSQKGGVGKTTTLAGVGAMTAMHRTDKILGLDVNPDGGSLAVKVPRTTNLNILDLRDALRKGPLAPVEFDRYVNHASHRFDTITMPPGQKPEQPLTGRDYEMISAALRERYPYKIIYVDCGTDLSAPVMDGVLAQMKQLIVVTSTIKDEATVAAGGLEALMREGRSDLVRNAITVLVEKAPKDPDVHVQREIDRTSTTIRGYFERLTSTVIPIPYDSRVRLGDVFNPDEISTDTHMAYLRVTAEVVDALRGRRG